MDTADNITTIGQWLGRIRKGARQVAAGGRRLTGPVRGQLR
ncbi:MAG: hypothetical protein ACRDRZ_11500 [Pseudonocardiaceae bacterium]